MSTLWPVCWLNAMPPERNAMMPERNATQREGNATQRDKNATLFNLSSILRFWSATASPVASESRALWDVQKQRRLATIFGQGQPGRRPDRSPAPPTRLTL